MWTKTIIRGKAMECFPFSHGYTTLRMQWNDCRWISSPWILKIQVGKFHHLGVSNASPMGVLETCCTVKAHCCPSYSPSTVIALQYFTKKLERNCHIVEKYEFSFQKNELWIKSDFSLNIQGNRDVFCKMFSGISLYVATTHNPGIRTMNSFEDGVYFKMSTLVAAPAWN